MDKIWTIARHEYVTNLRRVGFRLMLLGVPLLGLIGLIVAGLFSGQIGSALEAQFTGGEQARDRNFGVVDQSGRFSPILPEYQRRFIAYENEATGREAVRAGEIDQLLVIPADYLSEGSVRVIGEDTSLAAQPNPAVLQPFFVDHLIGEELDPALRSRLVDVYDLVSVPLNGEAEGGDGFASFFLSFFLPYIMGLLLVMTIFISGGYLLRGVAEEKESRIIELMLSSVNAEQLLTGKVLGLGALGLTQIVVWVVSFVLLGWVGAQWLGLPVPGFAVFFERPEVPLLLIGYYLLGFLVYAVLLGAIGALGTSMRESQQLTGFVSVFALLPVMLGGFILPNPNGMLARVLSLFPLTAPTMMMLRLPLTSVPLLDIIVSIVGLLITIPLVIWLGARLFRLGLLLYGQRPGLSQIMRALRQA
jgi:ABC-2 type transport system permease protein